MNESRRKKSFIFLSSFGLSIVTFALIINLVLMRFHLDDAAEQFIYSFSQLTAKELASGDTFVVSQKLALSTDLTAISCVIASKDGKEFFRKDTSMCSINFFNKLAVVDKTKTGGIKISFVFNLPHSLKIMSIIGFVTEIIVALLFFLVSKYIYDLNRERLLIQLNNERSIMIAHSEKDLAFSRMTEIELEKSQALHRATQAELEKSEAISRMTQSMAHDVRKPFAVVKSGLFSLREVESVPEMHHKAQMMLNEVEGQIIRVEGILNDVMEIGRTNAPIKESTSLESLVQSAVKEAFQVFENSRVDVQYDFGHSKQLAVEGGKISRVLSNIIYNGIDAMGGKGKLSFWSKDVLRDGIDFVEFVIGNNGPVIPEDVIPRLFSQFYTAGKKGGTGLGLAIAEKAVKAHGGEIWCESPGVRDCVEFHMTLPFASINKMPLSGILLASSEEAVALRNATLAFNGEKENFGDDRKSASFMELDADIEAVLQKRIEPFKILILDDESFYRKGLCERLAKTTFIKRVIFEEQTDPDAAINFVHTENPDLVILDVDLGTEKNGFAVAAAVRNWGYQGMICIHSNRGCQEDFASLVEVKADNFCPKPMSRIHFMKLIAESLGIKFRYKENAVHKVEQSETMPLEGLELPTVILIEDSAMMRMVCQDMMKDAHLLAFSHPEEFLEELERNNNLFHKIKAVLLDNDYESLSSFTGLEFGKIFKERYAPKFPLFLFSNGDFSAEELTGSVDCVAKKMPTTLKNLMMPIG